MRWRCGCIFKHDLPIHPIHRGLIEKYVAWGYCETCYRAGTTVSLLPLEEETVPKVRKKPVNKSTKSASWSWAQCQGWMSRTVEHRRHKFQWHCMACDERSPWFSLANEAYESARNHAVTAYIAASS